MKIATIQNNEVLQVGEHTDLFPNMSFPPTGLPEEFVIENSVKYVKDYKPYDDATQKLVDAVPYIEGEFVYTVAVADKSQEELAEYEVILGNSIRTQRNSLLVASDWTQVADAPVDKPAWATYRQALRDVTAQEGFPFNVVFPTPPL